MYYGKWMSHFLHLGLRIYPAKNTRMLVLVFMAALVFTLFSPAVVNPAADDLASKINMLLKEELEEEFGPLNDQIRYDKEEIWGRVIAIDYELPQGEQLDDTWGNKVVEALSRLGITAEYDGSEVRADGQEIAGKVASSIQFTTARTLEDPDVIGFTAMFP
jgi:hypothetical protein